MNGKVETGHIDGVNAKELPPGILEQVQKGSIVCSDIWKWYIGIPAKVFSIIRILGQDNRTLHMFLRVKILCPHETSEKQ